MKLLPFRELLGRAGFTDFRLPSTPKDEEGHECEIYFGGAGRVLGAEGVACQHLESVDLPSGLSSIAVGNESALRLEDAALMDDRVFTCEMGTGDQPMVRVEYRGGTEEFRPEEVSLMLMPGTKEIVEAQKVNINIKEETYEKLLSLVPIEMLELQTNVLSALGHLMVQEPSFMLLEMTKG